METSGNAHRNAEGDWHTLGIAMSLYLMCIRAFSRMPYYLLFLRLAITGMVQMETAAIYGIASIPVCTRSLITSSAVGGV